ncbi:hypothetical protein C5N14_10280 [Micromonospora sp. MW-13]|nr:hypothetical protein C5N14_10280 [Micromonospora sp. MW-13]
MPQGSTIDFQRAEEDWHKIEFRMSRYDKLWNNRELRDAYEDFKEQMTFELRLKAQGRTNDEINAEVVNRFGADRVAPFAQLMADNHAFSAPAKWWFKHQRDSDFDVQFPEAVQQFRSKLALWGKIGPAVAERITEQSGNRMLEATPGGQIFDNIMLGTGSFFNYPPGFNRMWEQFSHQLVAVTDGLVDAHVYRGVMIPSVLHNTEAKILFEKVDRREIEGLRVVAWEFVGNNKIAKAGEYVVRSQGSYDERVPKLEKGKTSKTFNEHQQQLYEQLSYRREEYNRIGLQDSLPELPPLERKDSNYVFVVSDANQPEVMESPETLTRKWSMALESQTADNPLAQLDQMLAVLEYAQSSQEWPGSGSSSVDLTGSLANLNTSATGSLSGSFASILVPPTRRNTALNPTDAELGPLPEDPTSSLSGSDYSPTLDAVPEEWPPPADPDAPVDAEDLAGAIAGSSATSPATGTGVAGEADATPAGVPSPRPASAEIAGRAAEDMLLPGDLSPAEVSDWFPWLGGVNPYRDRGEQFATNCVLAAIGTDMSLVDGVGHQVPPEAYLPVAWLKQYTGRPLVEAADYDAVVEVMRAAEPGARGVMVVTREGDRISHPVNVVRTDDGKVVFLDGQQGGLARGPARPGRVRFVATTDGVGVPRAPSTAGDDATATVPAGEDLAGAGGESAPAPSTAAGILEGGDVAATPAGSTPEVERLTRELAGIRDRTTAVESDLAAARNELSSAREAVARQVDARAAVPPALAAQTPADTAQTPTPADGAPASGDAAQAVERAAWERLTRAQDRVAELERQRGTTRQQSERAVRAADRTRHALEQDVTGREADWRTAAQQWTDGMQAAQAGGAAAADRAAERFRERNAARAAAEQLAAHAAEMSEVNERNVEAKRTFHQYRYDVTAVIYGPHGTLLVDAERGLYVMREQASTVPVTTTPSTRPVEADQVGDVAGAARG